MFVCATCACTHTRKHTPDFSWLLPLFAKKLSLQRKARVSTVERHRGNWSPTAPDLSDGKRRQHLVIASFGISFLPFSLRPFVIIFYNRMSNLPLAEHRECLSSPPPPVTHTRFHSLSNKRLSTSLHVTAWPLHNCELSTYWPTIWPSLLSVLISPLSFGCQVKSCVGEIHAFLQKKNQWKESLLAWMFIIWNILSS